MRLTTLACGLLLCAFVHSSTAAEADGLLGDWVGGYEEDGRWVLLQAHFRTDGTEVAVTLDVPLDFRTGMRSKVVLHNSRVRFQVEKPERQLFDGKLAGGAMDGTVKAGERTRAFHLTRVATVNLARYAGIYRFGKGRVVTVRPLNEMGLNGLALIDFKTAESRGLFALDDQTFFCGEKLLVTHPTEAKFQFTNDPSGTMQLTWTRRGSSPIRGTRLSFAQEEITFSNGGTHLNGTLSLPQKKGPYPAIVFIHGSGPGGRDELRFIADYFLVNGFATLVYGKRSNWLASSFSNLADDALGGVRALKSRADIQQVGLWGVSQGGWLVALAASRSRDVAFIINESGPGMTPEEQMHFVVRSKLQAAGFDGAVMTAASNLVRKNFASVRIDSGWDELARANEAAASEPWFTHMSSVKMRRDDPPFWRLNAFFDPAPFLRQVQCPVLAIYGERDTLVPASQSAEIWRAALKGAGNRDVTVKIFPTGDHGLREAPGGTLKDLPKSRGFVPDYFETQRAWVSKRIPTSAK